MSGGVSPIVFENSIWFADVFDPARKSDVEENANVFAVASVNVF